MTATLKKKHCIGDQAYQFDETSLEMDLHNTVVPTKEKDEVIILSSSSEDGESSCDSIIVLSDSEDEDSSQDIVMKSEFSEESSSESDGDVIIVKETDLVLPQEDQVEEVCKIQPQPDNPVQKEQAAEENLDPSEAKYDIQEGGNADKPSVPLKYECVVQEYQEAKEKLFAPTPGTDVQEEKVEEEELITPETEGTKEVLAVCPQKPITRKEELIKENKDDCVTSSGEDVEEIVKKIVDSRKNCDVDVDSDIDTAAWHHLQPQHIGADKIDTAIKACQGETVMKKSSNNTLRKPRKLAQTKTMDSAWKTFCLNSAQRSMSATRKGTSVIREKRIAKTMKKSGIIDKFKKEKCLKPVQVIQGQDEMLVCNKVKLLTAASLKKMSSSFKIPKEKEPYFPVEVKVALSTGDKRVDRILAEFDTMYDRAEKVLKESSQCKLKPASDEEEKDDILNRGWDEERSLKTNEDRKRFAQTKFGNPMASNPARNLTVQGFRAASKRTVDGCEKVKDPFHAPVDKNATKKIQYQDFTVKMKHVFAVKFKQILGNTKSVVEEKSAVKDFQSYIRHYKTAQEETQNFLEYYDMKGLPEMVTQEVTDIENQFSTFQNYYGQPDNFPCKPCGRSHKFCQ